MTNLFTENPDIRLHGGDQNDSVELPFSLPLELTVRDRETIAALWRRAEGEPREQFALEALKIGVLALRQASGVIDASLVQQEATAWLKNIEAVLREHESLTHQRLAGTLREYFDPEDGRFNERVQRLVADEGELQQVLTRQIAGNDSQLAKTLAGHVGKDSPLIKLLNPQESAGLFATLRTTLESELAGQRDRILKEFSLDQKDGALSRLVTELSARHGKLEEGLAGKIDGVVKEFSLDEENSALSRLVRNVDRAQRTISSEFSLDNEASALTRLRRELFDVIQGQDKKNREFQEEVKVALGKIVATRAEAARGTQHGATFEDAVREFVMQHAQHQGDVATNTSDTVGLIRNRKVGDVVVELGADSAAPGAKLVIEAKEDKSYDLAKAITELEVARKNRGAAVGMFVFSAKTAADPIQPICRHGGDVFVAWDAEDASTDAYLRGGLLVARALCLNEGRRSEARQADFDAIDKAVLEIEKQAGKLGEIKTRAETIHSSSTKILDIVRISQKALSRQIESLRDHIGDLEESARAD